VIEPTVVNGGIRDDEPRGSSNDDGHPDIAGEGPLGLD